MKMQRLAKVRFVALLGSVWIAGLAFPGMAFPAEGDASPTITVQIYNYSLASPSVLEGAEREAGRILRMAGLGAVWLECPLRPSTTGPQGHCEKALEATDLRLRVLGAQVTNKFQDTVFGFAVHPVLASVYYEYAARRAKRDDADFEAPIILGCAIAHELGHLLLGTNSHSDAGIMQPRWESNQFRQLMTGNLVFTTEQSKLMREQARTRMGLHMGNSDPGENTMLGSRNQQDQAAVFDYVESAHSRPADAQVTVSVYNDAQVPSDILAGRILGSVIAHEMGHLLLGSSAHAISGIMRARWESAELHRIAMGTLMFLPEQSKRMHARIAMSKASLVSKDRPD